MSPSSAPGQLLRVKYCFASEVQEHPSLSLKALSLWFFYSTKESEPDRWLVHWSFTHSFPYARLDHMWQLSKLCLRKPWRKSEHHSTQAYWVSRSSWLSLFLGQLVGLKPWNVQVRKLSICPVLLAGSFQIGFGVIGSPWTGDLKGQSCLYCSCQRQ